MRICQKKWGSSRGRLPAPTALILVDTIRISSSCWILGGGVHKKCAYWLSCNLFCVFTCAPRSNSSSKKVVHVALQKSMIQYVQYTRQGENRRKSELDTLPGFWLILASCLHCRKKNHFPFAGTIPVICSGHPHRDSSAEFSYLTCRQTAWIAMAGPTANGSVQSLQVRDHYDACF